MNPESSTTQMTFFLNPNNEKKMEDSSKKTETYLILQNDHLHLENINLRNKNMNILIEKDEMELELDRNDTSLRYLRTLQKNLKLLNDENEKLRNNYEILFTTLHKSYKKQDKLLNYMTYNMYSLLFMSILVYFVSYLSFILALVLILSFGLGNYMYARFYMKYNLLKHKLENEDMKTIIKVKLNETKKLKSSITELKKTLPSILDMIDNC
jgi:hypothetical protein